MSIYSHISQEQLKYHRKLLQKKYRQAEHKFIIEGVHLVEEALDSDWHVEALLVDEEFLKKNTADNLILKAKKNNIEVFQVSEREIEKLSDAVTAQGIVGIVRMKMEMADRFWQSLQTQSVIVALDSVADPGNLGTILRTCDWFGVDGVLLSEDTVDLYNPKVLRATMGAVFHVPILTGVGLSSIVLKAQQNGFKVLVTSAKGGIALKDLCIPDKTLLIFGNESAGVSQELLNLADQTITISRVGKAESLNVAVSCGIVLQKLRNGNN